MLNRIGRIQILTKDIDSDIKYLCIYVCVYIYIYIYIYVHIYICVCVHVCANPFLLKRTKEMKTEKPVVFFGC